MFKNYISTVTPAFIVIILDQSSRMDEPFKKDLTKAEYQCKLVNEFINNLIFSNSAGDKIKDRFFISIIGHSNDNANEIRSGYLSSFADNPLRIEKVKKKVSDGIGGLVEIEIEDAIYIDEIFNGVENQLEAFILTKNKTKDWIEQKGYCSTLIVNISGGFSSCWEGTTKIVNEIKKIGETLDSPFIFNLQLDANVKELVFPNLEGIYKESFTSQLYFEWSSYVSNDIIESGLRNGLRILKCSKLYSNHNFNYILNLINFGS
jgi:hypothetical protein